MTGYAGVDYYRTAAGAVPSATTMTTDPEWVASLTDDVVVNIDDIQDMTAPPGRHPHSHQHQQQQQQLISVEFVSQVVAFVVLDLIVVVGNVMVIAAVFTHSKLRCTTTNKFVVSLAVADLMVGLVVLPFSSANQVLRYWPFGTIWCRAWLAIDVWLCTASIFNLCAISLDRYLAISRPIKYPTVMSPMRARLLIITVWILSFVICFPPLIGWNGNGSDGGGRNSSSPITAGDDVFIAEIHRAVEGSDDEANCCFNESLLTFYDDLYTVGYSHLGSSVDQQNSQAIVRSAEDERPQCALTLEPGYIIYSACGSFWVPMLGMVVFYGKIYKTAVAATEAMKRGFVEKKTGKTGSGHGGGGGGLSNSTSENTLCTLRIHRGGSTNSSMIRHSAGCISELFPRPGADLQRTGSTSGRRSVDSRLMSMKAAGEVPGSDVVNAKAAAVAATADVRQPRNSHRPNVIAQPLPTIVITSSLSCTEDVAAERKKSSETTADCQQAKEPSSPGTFENSVQNGIQSDSDRKRLIQNNCKSDRSEKPDTTATDDRAADGAEIDKIAANLKRNNSRKRASSFLGLFESEQGNVQNQVNGVDATKRSSIQIMAARFAKLHIISQLRSLNKEKRAAKTVGIIVGCFVVCWAPFFTVYLAEAFCRQCTPTVVFHVFFWLGYCNSAANPFIYGLCSRDFRYAFQKFLRCECIVGRLRSPREGLVRQTNGQVMGMLQMMTLQIVARGAASTAAANV